MAGFCGEYSAKLKNDAQHVRDFHKSDALAQTNQIKYGCFFLHDTENTKKIFSQDLKIETKIPDTFF